MSYDLTALRAQFPSLASGLAHFDGPGGTQSPRAVGEAIAATLTGPLSNRGRLGLSERNADDAVGAFRAAYGDFLGMPPESIVYGRSATALVYDVSRALEKTWQPGDEIVVSRLDHDANVRPWVQAAQRVGLTVRWLDFDPATSEITWESVESAITERTRLVAVTAASNLIGTRPPVRPIADRAHAVGALVCVDGVHAAAHGLIDVPALGADLFVCSPYKFLGPHCGVLTGTPQLLESLQPDKLAPSTDAVPERFELGTLPYEIMAGATAAVDVIADIGPGELGPQAPRRERLAASWRAIHEHELALRIRLDSDLAGFGDRVRGHSHAADRTPTTLLTFPGRRGWAAYEFLASRGVQAPAGSFYAIEPFRRLALDDEHPLRIGLAPYTDASDLARLQEGLAEFLSAAG